MQSKDLLSIGYVAKRSGVAASTLRFYETRGLIQSSRSKGNQRAYARSVLRRISVIRVAQSLGLSLAEINETLQTLPDQRTPTQRDWQKLSTLWSHRLNQQIESLEKLRDKLSGCIGCGCLSLKRCALYNNDDEAKELGNGPRFLMGDESLHKE
ncbi:MAG: MerR family redox-sensitive transcriptional activator SoxR [Parasphingorhabdus sp.]|jgi:MerR family redox-sensitive transcriptional activator SoxR